MVRKLEALVDAFSNYNGYQDSEGELYASRNPLGLLAKSQKHPRDSKGRRVFHSLLDGYQAALFDLQVKCAGQSHTRLKKESTLRDLVVAYGNPEAMVTYIVRFLRKALGDISITSKTPLSFFME